MVSVIPSPRKESSPAASRNEVSGTPQFILAPDRSRTLALVALVWYACGTLYLLPYLLRGGLDLPAILSHYGVSSVGLVLSAILLALTPRFRRLSGLPVLLTYAAIVIALAALLAAVDIVIFESIYGFFGRRHASATTVSYAVNWSGNFAIFMSQYSLIAVAFWTLDTLDESRQQQVELEIAKTATAEAQSQANRAKLSALRYQLNPHFLFNTLNSISSLVVTKRNSDAEMMLANLSEFLRTTLAGDPDAAQTLEGELETIDAYLGLERIRFGERLEIAIDCPPELREAQLPHFLLQPLVENAVKHGLSPSDERVAINITARAQGSELLVAVENDCNDCCPSTSGHGVGLRNVRERLEAVYAGRGRLETIQREAGFIAIVRVPLEFAIA